MQTFPWCEDKWPYHYYSKPWSSMPVKVLISPQDFEINVLRNYLFSINVTIGKHHWKIIFVEWQSWKTTDQTRLRTMSMWKTFSQFIQWLLANGALCISLSYGAVALSENTIKKNSSHFLSTIIRLINASLYGVFMAERPACSATAKTDNGANW